MLLDGMVAMPALLSGDHVALQWEVSHCMASD